MHKGSLSKPNQWLIEQCQITNFGSITFYIRSGEPDLTRSYRTVRTVRLVGGDNGPRPEASNADFELRGEHLSLLAMLPRLPDGTCVTIKVMYGLPTKSIDIEENHQAA